MRARTRPIMSPTFKTARRLEGGAAAGRLASVQVGFFQKGWSSKTNYFFPLEKISSVLVTPISLGLACLASSIVLPTR